MNFKIAFVGTALLALSSILAVGCGGSDCQKAADDVSAKLASCPNPPAAATVSNSSSAECTAAAGTLALCQSACLTAASCDCIGGGDATKCTADQLKTETDCLGKCM